MPLMPRVPESRRDDPFYRRVHSRQPYVYVVGPVGYPPGTPGAHQTVMDIHGSIREGHPERDDHLIALGCACWLALNNAARVDEGRTPDYDAVPPVPVGFTYRLIRLTTGDYNRMVARANALGGRSAAGTAGGNFRPRDPIHERYLRKAQDRPDDPDVWDITTWGLVRNDLDMNQAPWPSPDPFRRLPDDAVDGQHRLS